MTFFSESNLDCLRVLKSRNIALTRAKATKQPTIKYSLDSKTHFYLEHLQT